MPGVQPAAEEEGLFVRGGDAHESKTFFDGILVNNPFTTDLPDIAQRGRFSPFMFKGTSFTTGAYSAQFGEALSSTMSMDSKDLSPKTKSDIGIMSVGLDATHAHRFKNSSLDVNGSYYNLAPVFSVVKQNTEWTKEPEAFNTNAFYKMNTGSKGLLKVYATYGHSRVGIISPAFSDITKDVNYNIKGDNLFLVATWQQYLNDKWKINIGGGYGDDKNYIDINDNDVQQHDKSLHLRASVTHYYGKSSDVKAGVEYFNFTSAESYNTLYHALENSLMASFIETNYYISRKIAVRMGVRHEQASAINSNNLAPRASLAYKWNETSQVSFGYGKFYQLPGNEFLYITKTFGFENATHYVFNYQYQKEKRTFRAEAYHKKYDNLVKTNNSVLPGMDNSGYGYSQGFDIFFRDNKTLRYADCWISYSYLDTKRNYHHYPGEARPDFAAEHVANFVGKYFISTVSTSIGASYTYASGRTYYNPNNTNFMADKTKDYHNISVNVSYLTSLAKQFTIVYLSIENIFGINNVFGYRYSPDGAVRQPIVPSAPRSIFLGVFITIGDGTYR